MLRSLIVPGVFITLLVAACAGVEPPESRSEATPFTDVVWLKPDVMIRVGLDGVATWNDRTVSRAELAALMDDSAASSPRPSLMVIPAGAEYGYFHEVVQMAMSRGLVLLKIGVMGGSLK